jgi:5-methylcytosine-specific restriction endonuclease McrA
VTNPVYATARWRRLRRMVMERDGHRCTVEGCDRPADAVDHVVSLEDGGAPYSLLNLRAICTFHNSSRVHVVKLGQLGVSPSRRW